MKHIDFYLDFISPYAYLAFERLPQALEGLSYEVTYRPILFAGLLKHHGQLGPAEIDGKREWTYRQVAWLAHTNGISLRMPHAHPFNPLPLLRLALACASQGTPNRYQCETIFRHAWSQGGVADDVTRLAALTRQLNPSRDPAGSEVKQELKSATQAAISAGLFGVPSMVVDGRVFWGFDALPMLRAYLEGDRGFDQIWTAPEGVEQGLRRE
ncbi:2-hydroxychromene-2-carboxylate isomerase [Ottowia thiooxydans]|uniref:2-hydroxychromene-2-carboxylate isomerase n=1 Tax=Ottowia thiooxydans TaxID=219182 RepID=UPI00042510C0|nr:2-hydroxychromene-2-carboxylate isomerase [Ottowia thiooxydans]